MWIVPVGFVRAKDGRIEKTPDLQVQQAIEMVLEKFRQLGSARQTLFWLREEKLKLPHAVDAIQVEGQQGVLGGFHGSGLVMLVLAQEQEVLAQLVLGERGRVALEMFGELADIADVFLLGGRPVVFEFDKLLEP